MIAHSIKTLLTTFAIILLLLAMMLRQGCKAVVSSAFYTYYVAIEDGISIKSEVNYDDKYKVLESEQEYIYLGDLGEVILYLLTQ